MVLLYKCIPHTQKTRIMAVGSEESLLMSSTSGYKCPPLCPQVTIEAQAWAERGSVAGEAQRPPALAFVSHPQPTLPVHYLSHYIFLHAVPQSCPMVPRQLYPSECSRLRLWSPPKLHSFYPTRSQSVSPVSPTFKMYWRVNHFFPSMDLVLSPIMSGLS